MRKLVFAIILAFTFYIAGMYRHPGLMVLFFAEIALTVVMFLACHYMKRNLSLEIPQKSGVARKEQTIWCALTARNKGKLPVSCFRVRLKVRYPGQRTCRTKRIYGESECGENLLQFGILARYCGLVQLKVDKLKVYDYLSLFHAGKSIGQEMTIAVFPTESSIETQLWAFLESQGSILPAQAAKGAREDGDEVRQIREYRQGDFVRHIHWNQSARTGQYWVKEYERETNAQVCLWIDLSGQRKAARRQLDVFYELLWSFLVGMLKRDMAVQAFWREEGGNGIQTMRVSEGEQCQELFLSLYRLEAQKAEREQEGTGNSGEKTKDWIPENAFGLDLKLGLYFNEVLMYRFSRKELDGRNQNQGKYRRKKGK